MQQQVRSFVGCKTACKTQRQRIAVKQMLRAINRLGRRAGYSQLPGQSFASVFNKRLAGGGAKLPETGVGNAANVLLQGLRRPQPAVLSTGFRPKIVGCRRVPGRHVDSVGHMSDRDFVLRPVRKERQKDVPAHLPVQATHAIDRPAPANRQIGHVERFRRVVRVLAAQGQQIVEGYTELRPCITSEVLLDERRSETIEAGSHRRVGGEKVARPGDGQRDLESPPGFLHEASGAFQHREGRMPFIQVADFRLDAERREQSPSANPEQPSPV